MQETSKTQEVEKYKLTVLEERIDAIYNDEFIAAKRFYNNARHLIGVFIAMTGIAVTISVGFNIVEFIRFGQLENRIDRKISEFLGFEDIEDFSLVYRENIKGYFGGFLPTANKFYPESFKAQISTTIELKGTDARNAIINHVSYTFEGMSYPVDISSIYEDDRQNVDFFERNHTRSAKGFFNINSPITISITMDFFIANCTKYKNFTDWITTKPTGKIRITLDLENDKEPLPIREAPFVIIAPKKMPNCPI